MIASSKGRPRIVAEIGTAHEGDIGRAAALIRAAREAGADTAKFQLVRAHEILHPKAGSVELPGGKVPLYERFTELERDEEFYEKLRDLCHAEGLRFLCTPFGTESAKILRGLSVEEFKVASPELNHLPLLRQLVQYQKPIVLSAGVATMADIAEALSVFPGGYPVTVLQCVTAYPAPEEDYNLRTIPALRAAFGVGVGVSDHSMDPVLVPALATLLGASMVEKHITLHRGNAGLDDPIALEPEPFSEMVGQITAIADRLMQARDADPVALAAQELEIENELRDRFGNDRVERVLGSGIKGIAASEARNYGYTNRSIHAVSSLQSGTQIREDSVSILRTEKNLTPGLHPRYWSAVLGARLVRPIEAGQGLTWDHLLSR